MWYLHPVEILFEDSKIIAVNKPSGIPSHSLGEEESVESIIRASKPAILLHRLDTGTSGVLLFGKTDDAFQKMRLNFKNRMIEKHYRAWSEATPDGLALFSKLVYPREIMLALGHHPKSKKRMVVIPLDKKISIRGKPLPAHTRILAASASTWMSIPAIEFKIQLITGVMHQIRVHLKHLGFPLIGDPIYQAQNKIPTVPGETPVRLGLHAEKISFELDDYLYQIEAPAP